MKYTLLELTQSVLSSMDSDEINSINDTPESQQVVEVIKTVYDDIVSRGDLVVNQTLCNLVASNDPLKPVLMTKPDNVDRIQWVKYNRILNNDTDPLWDDMVFMPVSDFIEYTHNFNPSQTDVGTMQILQDGFVLDFMFKTNSSPQYYTSFDDQTLIFDGYDSSVSSTLESSKTLAYGTKTTAFTRTDSWTPNLQDQQFSLLLNEAKSLAWTELKQTVHQKAEQTARRNWRHIQKVRRNIPTLNAVASGSPSLNDFPNFGRR